MTFVAEEIVSSFRSLASLSVWVHFKDINISVTSKYDPDCKET